MVPSLVVFCIRVLAGFPGRRVHRRVPATPALLAAFPHAGRDPCVWAALARLVDPLPPDLHQLDLPLSHPALPLLQRIPHSPDFSLLTLLALPNCIHLRDHHVAGLCSLLRLLALDVRGCSVSSHALTALARGTSGPCGIRLLNLHGCPNIDNAVLSVLPKFPLLSAVDLRFTRCTPAAVNTSLSPLGFRPSDNNTLFHPAPLSLALCSLEKVARTAADPISLYSCPPQSMFRVHIDTLHHVPSHTTKSPPVATSHSFIRTISSAEDTVVFLPPLRKQAKSDMSSAMVSVLSTPSSVDNPVSNVSSFYENTPVQSRKRVLPLSAQIVQSSEGGKLDPLAIARSPPPWKILDTHTAFSDPPPCRRSASDSIEKSRRTQRWIGHTLNDPLKVDCTRLHKRDSDAVADMMHQFTTKRPKIESEFALAKAQAKPFVKSRNPFVRDVRSVFAQSSTNPDKSRSPAHKSARETESAMQLRACRSLPSQTEETAVERLSKPLKPITSLKPPILPKELLPPTPQYTPKPGSSLKQTRLSFSRQVRELVGRSD